MAVAAGLDHFIFDVYAPASDLGAALIAFLNSTSPSKASLGFCLLLQGAYGQALPWTAAPAFAAYFARAEYRLVLGERPLVYLFGPSADDFQKHNWAGWAEALAELAAASQGVGRGQPYVVFMSASPAQGLAALTAINAASPGGQGAPLVAGLSSYYLPGATPTGTPFVAFAAAGPPLWDDFAATGADVIVPVAAGWDNRPRNMTPVPWEPYVHPDWVVMPQPEELAAFVQSAVDWDAAHAAANPARVAVLSAMNEYDEGHYIGAVLPQYGGNARLEAIGRVLKPAAAAPASSLNG